MFGYKQVNSKELDKLKCENEELKEHNKMLIEERLVLANKLRKINKVLNGRLCEMYVVTKNYSIFAIDFVYIKQSYRSINLDLEVTSLDGYLYYGTEEECKEYVKQVSNNLKIGGNCI